MKSDKYDTDLFLTSLIKTKQHRSVIAIQTNNWNWPMTLFLLLVNVESALII